MKILIYLFASILLVAGANAQKHSNNFKTVNGKQYLEWSKITNLNQYTGFSEHDKTKISENGFIVVPDNYSTLSQVYDENNYNQAPSFVTSDLVLQCYSSFYDNILSGIEYHSLSAKLRALDSILYDYFIMLKRTNKNPAFTEAITKNCAFFALGLQLQKAQAAGSGEFMSMLSAEMQKIARRSTTEPSEICGTRIDYTQFIPRGHYTYNNRLRNYFRSMMWHQLAEFDLSTDCGLVQAMLISFALNGAAPAESKQLWESIYEVTNLFVGESDGLSLDNVYAAMNTAFGAKPSLQNIADKKKMAPLRTLLGKMYKDKSKIESAKDLSPSELKLSIMGQRYIPDGEITQRLTKYGHRNFPRGLDVPAAFGSKKAKSILFNTYKEAEKWPDYEKILAQLTKEFAVIHESKWTSNLYYYWLYCLKSLIERDPNGRYPFFMRNTAWETKSLNTFTASWAELRHNTVLYAMQSAAECGDGDEEKPEIDYPRCFLEPNPTFYKKMLNLVEKTNTCLTKYAVMNQDQQSAIQEFDHMMKFLDTVNNKELEGLPITRHEHEEMRIIGGMVESITVKSSGIPFESEVTADGQEPEALMKEGHDGIIVDVHNSMGNCLEVGVGSGNIIYVAAEIEGKLRMLRGAVFSYYEFTRATSERLDDHAWHAMIYNKALPEAPEWTKEIMSDGTTLVQQRTIEEYIRAEPGLKHKKPRPSE